MKEPQKDSYYVKPFIRFLAGIVFLIITIGIIIAIVLTLMKHPSVQFTPPQDIWEWFNVITRIIGALIGFIMLGKIVITGNARLPFFKKRTDTVVKKQ